LEEEQPIAVRELDPAAHLALKHNQLTWSTAFSASSRLIGLKGESKSHKEEE
jgi:hypothetical protein